LVSLRRSGRLSNVRRPNKDNEEYELIDLTIDGDCEDEQGIVCIIWYCVFLLKNIPF
jgi:hypothetical protein